MNGKWKPKEDHPWKLRAAAAKRASTQTSELLESIREDEELEERMEQSDLERQVKEFFQ